MNKSIVNKVESTRRYLSNVEKKLTSLEAYDCMLKVCGCILTGGIVALAIGKESVGGIFLGAVIGFATIGRKYISGKPTK